MAITELTLAFLIGLVLLALVRFSRKNFEKETASVNDLTLPMRIAIFAGWSTIWSLLAYFFPYVFALALILQLSGIIPLGMYKKSLLKWWIDLGFLSAITFGLGVALYAHAT